MFVSKKKHNEAIQFNEQLMAEVEFLYSELERSRAMVHSLKAEVKPAKKVAKKTTTKKASK